ncbi:MAG: type II toxin-antitoxin system RelE/ParE family toxin [Patescibacteria group bacterium]
MPFLVVLKPGVQKRIDAIPPRKKDKITILLAVIARNPYTGKKLHGGMDYYSVRVWPYRMIYRVVKEKSLVVVTRVGHRKDIY